LPQLASYEGMGWFRRSFTLPADWTGQHLALRLEGVNYNAAVWVNGQFAGAHEGGFLRFELPVSALVVPGENVIVLRADNTRRHGEVPGKERGWRPYGGILREVTLVCRPLLRLEQPAVTAHADGTFRARVVVKNDTEQEQWVTVRLGITPFNTAVAGEQTPPSLPWVRGGEDRSPLLAKEGLGEVRASTPPNLPFARGGEDQSPLLTKEGDGLRPLGEVQDQPHLTSPYQGEEPTPPDLPLARGAEDQRSYLSKGEVVPARGECGFEFEGMAGGATPWMPEQPALYTATFELQADEMRDALPVTIGFRTVEARGAQLLLNGQPIRLRGFNRHEDSPRTGMATDLQQVERDLRHMKQLGANFVRLCHYPHHPGELDLCDRLGLLVMGEIPLYWWNGTADVDAGAADGERMATAKLDAAKRQLGEMIARDINHPCIIFWSVSNETHEQRPEVSAGNAALVEHARKLDGTRLVTHVSDHWPATPHFENDDVMCVNGYPTWSGRSWKSNPDYDVNESTRWWDERLAALHALFPDRPILISEFGYPTLYGVFGNALGEDTQVAALQAEAQAFDKPYVCGMTIWCYADHPWPEEPFVNSITTSPFGVVTRDRRSKRACETVRQLFNAPARTPYKDSPDNVEVRMFRPHLRDIPEVPFPEGYGVRPLRLNEGGLWEDIWRDAEPFFKIEHGLFHKEFGDDPAAVERRCYIITAPDSTAAGTISSWYARDINGQDYGRIHWVATRKAYQGRGIMRAGLSYALRQMAQWHERAVLDTSIGRVAAIKLYLDFGFLPDLDKPGAREAWLAFRRKLNHPALAVLDE
jgi:GNAT superfamily N-acetyltransferase